MTPSDIHLQSCTTNNKKQLLYRPKLVAMLEQITGPTWLVGCYFRTYIFFKRPEVH